MKCVMDLLVKLVTELGFEFIKRLKQGIGGANSVGYINPYNRNELL